MSSDDRCINKTAPLLIKAGRRAEKKNTKNTSSSFQFKLNPSRLYLSLASTLILLTVLTIFVSGGSLDAWASYFFLPGSRGAYAPDSLMDFFNPILNAAQRGRWGEYKSIYPPLIEIIFYILSKFIPSSIISAGSSAELRASLPGIMLFMVIVLITTIFIIVYSLKLAFSTRGTHWSQGLPIALACIICEPFIYALERGNTIIAIPLLLIIFIYYYRSEKTGERLVAYSSLILATCLKLYPIIFILLVLRKNGIRECICVCVGMALALLLPFAFFKGIDSFNEFMRSLSGTTSSAVVSKNGFGYKINLINTLSYLRAIFPEARFLPMSGGISDYIIQGLLAISSLFVLVNRDADWKSTALLGCIALLSPSLGAVYNGCYLLPALIQFLSSIEKGNKRDYLYAVLFALALSPIPFSQLSFIPSIDSEYNRYLSTSCFINSIAFLLLWATLCLDMMVATMHRRGLGFHAVW